MSSTAGPSEKANASAAVRPSRSREAVSVYLLRARFTQCEPGGAAPKTIFVRGMGPLGASRQSSSTGASAVAPSSIA